jgi:hypothetical protein
LVDCDSLDCSTRNLSAFSDYLDSLRIPVKLYFSGQKTSALSSQIMETIKSAVSEPYVKDPYGRDRGRLDFIYAPIQEIDLFVEEELA